MENSETTQPSEKKSSSALATVLVLCVVAGAVVFFLKSGNLHVGQTTPKAAPVSSVMHLDTFTVNLSDPDQKAYLRLGVDLGLVGDQKAVRESEQGHVGLVRDTILGILMATKPADVATPEGKQKLKEQMLQALRQRAPELGVHDVYFTDFLMQQ